ncbi:hypothetical protein LDO31_02760 [Luteimonas sp. XNQY3]|nr:hypothetical protein [Luteimonas sp. XNQY3]MCD9005167.1 hypothetical protein [Luteimonas sp. XNQY3]
MAYPDMFAELKPPRAKPRVMMHAIDSGSRGPTDVIALFECSKCGHKSDWLICANWTEMERGEPCPKCNARTDGGSGNG